MMSYLGNFCCSVLSSWTSSIWTATQRDSSTSEAVTQRLGLSVSEQSNLASSPDLEAQSMAMYLRKRGMCEASRTYIYVGEHSTYLQAGSASSRRESPHPGRQHLHIKGTMGSAKHRGIVTLRIDDEHCP